MSRRSSPHLSGAGSSHALLFVALLALVAAAIGGAWLALKGEPTVKPAEVASKPEAPPDAAPTPTIEPVTVEETPNAVRAPEWDEAQKRARGTTFKLRDPKTGERTITTHLFEGTVVDDRDSEPVYYFWIYLIPPDQGDPLVAKNTWSPSHFRGGKFQLDHQPAGTYNLVVESREHEPVTRSIEIPYETGSLQIRLHHGSCIRGIIRDPSQMGLEEIDVELGIVALDPGFKPPMQRRVKTDKAGRYSFWKLPPGTYTLAASLLGDELAHESQFRLDPGGEVLRDFTLQRLGSLKLTVTNIADKPVPRARVLLVQEKDGRDRPIRTAYSDLTGVARLDFVREGSYKLRVQLQGYQTHEEPVAVAAGQGSRELPVRLEVATRAQ